MIRNQTDIVRMCRECSTAGLALFTLQRNMATVLTSPFSPTSLATEAVNEASKRNSKGERERDARNDTAGAGSNGKIDQKEFFWDQFVTYIATIIALLTVLDVTLQFFRGGGLSCRLPSRIPLQSNGNETVEPSRDDVEFVNTFCQRSLSRAEYYPLFVLIQGLVLAAPHYLWVSLFGGQFDFFFGLVQQLDRLRDSTTGQYRSQNFEIVQKLEKHFVVGQWRIRSIFYLYVGKLFIQLIVIIIAIIINGAVFQEKYFAFSFKCPRNFKAASPPEGWWLPYQVVCVFASFRLHRTIQAVNYLLLALAFITVVYAIVWCFTRHAIALGYKEIALFTFSSCLRPEEYVIPQNIFKPKICNDLDFLLMRLFQADSGYGNVFKDIQVNLYLILYILCVTTNYC